MSHNFRSAGSYYVSKAGRADGPATPDDPRLALTGQEEGQDIVLGTGVYQWPTSFNYNRLGYGNGSLRADGRVVVLGDGHSRYQGLAGGGVRLTGLRFEQFAGFQFRDGPWCSQCEFEVLPAFAGSPNSGITSAVFEDCVFRNVHFSNDQTAGLTYGQGGNLGDATFTRCLFFNCTFTSPARYLTQCYFDPTTRGWGGTPGTTFSYPSGATGNNVDPAADPAQGYGLRLDAQPAGLASPQGLSVPPLFNALGYNDFSVQPGSPHLAAGIGPRQYRQAATYLLHGPAAGQPVGADNADFRRLADGQAVALLPAAPAFTTAGGALVLDLGSAAGATGTGRLRTGAIAHAAGLPREISYIQTLSGSNFNTSYPSDTTAPEVTQPEVFNNNVPDASGFEPGAAGRNPNRLSYRLRWSTLPTAPDPTADAGWALGGAWVECEWNARPLYNPQNNVGNGCPDFDPATARPVICTWYQLEVVLTNAYYH